MQTTRKPAVARSELQAAALYTFWLHKIFNIKSEKIEASDDKSLISILPVDRGAQILMPQICERFLQQVDIAKASNLRMKNATFKAIVFASI